LAEVNVTVWLLESVIDQDVRWSAPPANALQSLANTIFRVSSASIDPLIDPSPMLKRNDEF
jgi:hypothetical protein